MMIRILVGYYSRSGTTEKMAEKIVEGMENSDADVEIELKEIKDVDMDSIPEYNALILGSPTYYGLPAAEIKEFIDESITHHGDLDGMVGGAFTSSANPAGGNETAAIAILEALLIHGMIVKGTPDGDHYAPVVIGSADEGELEQCEKYGKWMSEFVEDIHG